MKTRYKTNSGAVYCLKYHLVWCPKYRRKVLQPPVDARLKELLLQKAAELQIMVEALEVMPDHVHIFIAAEPILCVAEIVNRLKGYTSSILRKEFAELRSRLPTLWSRSYYAATVGDVSEEAVRKYIEAQKGK